MRKLTIAGGIATTLLGASVILAATPASTASPSAAPSATPAPSAAPGTTTAPSPSAAASTAWTATIQPLVIGGSVTVTPDAHGRATMDVTMQGLAPDRPLALTVLRGRPGSYVDPDVLFTAARRDVIRLGSGTLRLHLTAAEYKAVSKARSDAGFMVLLSDGATESLAVFPKA